jgi:hypothetical protein
LRDDAVIRGSGLFRPAPLDVGELTRLPHKFAGLPGINNGSATVNLVIEGQFRACQAGRYSFIVVVEPGKQFGDQYDYGPLACWGDLRQGGSVLFNLSGAADTPTHFLRDASQSFSGGTNLTEGIHPLRLRLACGIAGGSAWVYNQMRKTSDTGFDIRVMGPGDRAPRAFRADEVFQPN